MIKTPNKSKSIISPEENSPRDYLSERENIDDQNAQGDSGLSYTPTKLLQNFFRKIASSENLQDDRVQNESAKTAKPTAEGVNQKSIEDQRAERALRALRREKQKNAKNNKFQRSKTSIVVKRPETAPVKNSQNKLVLEESKSFEDMAQTSKNPTPTPSFSNPRRGARLSYIPNAPAPNTKTARSKVGSLQYINHTPKGGNVKIINHKINVTKKSKIGSLDNIKHQPKGGNLKIIDNSQTDIERLKQVGSKCGSLNNIKHTPKGGNVKIFNQNLDHIKNSAKSKCGSLDNANYTPKKSDVVIENKKLNFKEKAGSKIGSLDNSTHTPKGGNVKIFNQKVDYSKVQSKSGSLQNIKHKPGGGDVIIYDEHNASTMALAEHLKESMIIEEDNDAETH